MSADKSVVTNDDAKLSKQLADRGIEASTWNTLKNSCFPGAAQASILMAIDYCLARKLDVLKKPCHIVPMQVKQGDAYIWRDVILPGIYEYRTTAQRTGLYLGHTKPEYGPEKGTDAEGDVLAPQHCDMTFFRWNKEAKQRVEFPVRVYFREVVGLTKDGKVNARWGKAPIQMLTKCTEAAGLREAFPDEIGGEPTMEEMVDQIIDARKGAAPEGTRTEQAKERLRAQLTDQAGTGGLDLRTMAENHRDHVVAERERTPEPAKTEAPAFKYDIASALAYLRMQKTVEQLTAAWKLIEDDYEFSGREMPIDIEAIYRDLKEDLEGKPS
jgi:phage recombination protein Bet